MILFGDWYLRDCGVKQQDIRSIAINFMKNGKMHVQKQNKKKNI